ncbi:MAG: peptidylprolyl isomerase [Ilumatobacteraceae bacterium]
MIRRRAAGLLVPLAGLLVLTGCATFDENDDAAVVQGTAITRQEYQDFLTLLASEPELSRLVVDDETDTVAGGDGRQWLTYLVSTTLSATYLAEAGITVTDADRQTVLDSIPEDEALRDVPELLDTVVEAQAALAARERVAAPSTSEIEQRYNESPASLGVICARHIVVATAAEADDVLVELDQGADFAGLAAERSTDPAAAENGGVLTDGGGDCIARSALGQVPELVVAADEAGVGVPTRPVESSAGWHILLQRPYDEVGEALDTLFEQQAGALLFDAYAAQADVQIDPRYGRWDSPTRAVVAL